MAAARLDADEWSLRLLAGAHHVDGLALQRDHLRRGERAAGRPWARLDLDELAGGDALLELRLDRVDRSPPPSTASAHRAAPRVRRRRPRARCSGPWRT